jgi:hypothetical protein
LFSKIIIYFVKIAISQKINNNFKIDKKTEKIRKILYGFSGIFFTTQTPLNAPRIINGVNVNPK